MAQANQVIKNNQYQPTVPPIIRQIPLPIQNQQKKQQQLIKKLQNYQIFMNMVLGEGQFGKVHMALDERSSQTEPLYYAVKVISLKGVGDHQLFNPNSMLKKEIEVLKKAKHQNLVCLQEIQQSPNNLYIFLDYCNGGDLRGYLKSKKNQLSYEESIDFLKQIVAGYEALHKENIIHRDLKPENILMNDGQLKIGDFGFGRIMDGDLNQQVRMSRKCTPIYGSPQILQGVSYSSKCDVWSLGIILYELLIGKWPFYAQSEPMLVKDIIQKVGNRQKLQIPISANKFITPECIDLLQRMLMLEENDRISWVEIFKHPLIVGTNDQENILNEADDNEDIPENDQLMHKSIIKNKKNVMKDHLVKDIPTIKEKPKIFEQIPKTPYLVKQVSGQDDIPKLNYNQQQQLPQQNTPKQDNNLTNLQQYQVKSPQQLEINNQQTLQKQQQQKQQQQNIKIQDLFPEEDKSIPKYQLQMMQVKQKEMEKLSANKSDKIMLFLRNRALYANVSLQNLWDARKQLNLPNFIIKGLIYCQGGYYYLCLKKLKSWITKEEQCPIINDEDFEIYKKSEYFTKTYNTILKDYEESNNFFEPFQKVMPKELQKELFEAKKNQKYEDDVLSDMEKFIHFIKSSFQEKESYIFMAQVLIIRLLNFTSIPSLNQKALKAVFGVQIFAQLEVYQPLSQYQDFDFRKFYLEQLNTNTEEQFKEKILKYNEKYIIPQIQKKQQQQQQQQQQVKQQFQ